MRLVSIADRSKAVTAALMGMTALCFLGYLATAGVRLFLNFDYVHGLVPLFDLGAGWRLPALYIGSLLGLSAFLCLRIGAACGGGARRSWFLLALVALILGADEVSRIHIVLDAMVRASFTPLARLSYGWILPTGAGLLLALPLLWPGPAELAPMDRDRFLTGATVYLAGLLGAEALKSWYYAAFQTSHDLGFALLTAAGGLGRMAGLAVIVGVLLRQGRLSGPAGLPVSIPNSA